MSEVQPWREALAEYIRTQALPVEKFGHQPRLYALTQAIGKGSDYDDDVVYAAAYLHDLGVFTGHRPEDLELLRVWDNTTYAIAESPVILHQVGFPAQKIAAVLDAIRTHQPAQTPFTLEATILRDADLLEQLGAIGALRTICKVGRDTRFCSFSDAVTSLHQALTRLPKMIMLAEAQRLAAGRIESLRNFLDSVDQEAGPNLF